jgi:hypothetical protein
MKKKKRFGLRFWLVVAAIFAFFVLFGIPTGDNSYFLIRHVPIPNCDPIADYQYFYFERTNEYPLWAEGRGSVWLYKKVVCEYKKRQAEKLVDAFYKPLSHNPERLRYYMDAKRSEYDSYWRRWEASEYFAYHPQLDPAGIVPKPVRIPVAPLPKDGDTIGITFEDGSRHVLTVSKDAGPKEN